MSVSSSGNASLTDLVDLQDEHHSVREGQLVDVKKLGSLSSKFFQPTDLLRAGVHEVGGQLLLVPVLFIPRFAQVDLAIWGPVLPLMMVTHGVGGGHQGQGHISAVTS